MYADGKPIKNSVKSYMIIRQGVVFAEEDGGKFDARRIITVKNISKTVSIDSNTLMTIMTR